MEKKLNIIDKETNTIMRVGKSLAIVLVDKGTHKYTSKSRLKSVRNRQAKLERNQRAIKMFGTTGGEFTHDRKFHSIIGGQKQVIKDNKVYTNLNTVKMPLIFNSGAYLNIRTLERYKRAEKEDKQFYQEQIDHIKERFFDRNIYETGTMRIVTKFN